MAAYYPAARSYCHHYSDVPLDLTYLGLALPASTNSKARQT